MLGLFDSGIGGLTVVKELLRRAPNVSFLYLGDKARAPYGNKTEETIERYAIEDVSFLVEKGATEIIIACNTASSLALDHLKEVFPHVRFFDVISPAIEATSKLGKKKIGVIGTRATIESGVYAQRLKEKGFDVYSAACPLFVYLVEEGWINKPETQRIARTYLATLKQKQIDTLILACTHYPLMQKVIKQSLQKRVKIIDSPSALFESIERDAPELLKPESQVTQEFYFTEASPQTDALASRWLNRPVKGLLATLNELPTNSSRC